MNELNRKVGEMNHDGLITDLNPPVQVFGRTIAKTSADKLFKRGMIMARSEANGNLYPLGSVPGASDTLTPDCVLCDDTLVTPGGNVNAAVYTAGCFDPGKITVADGYTMTDEDMDELRMRNIVFRAAFAAN